MQPHAPNLAQVLFLGAGLRCGWAVLAFWAVVAYALIVGGLCLFFKGCSVREGEEAMQCKSSEMFRKMLTKGRKFRRVERKAHRTSPGEFLAEPKQKSTAGSSDTSGQSSSGTTAKKRSSKTAGRSQWRQQ